MRMEGLNRTVPFSGAAGGALHVLAATTPHNGFCECEEAAVFLVHNGDVMLAEAAVLDEEQADEGGIDDVPIFSRSPDCIMVAKN